MFPNILLLFLPLSSLQILLCEGTAAEIVIQVWPCRANVVVLQIEIIFKYNNERNVQKNGYVVLVALRSGYNERPNARTHQVRNFMGDC